MKRNKVLTYLLFLLLPLAVGGLAALVTYHGMPVYEQLEKPVFTPPSFLFPIVWNLLYVLMGIGAARVWLSQDPMRGQRLRPFVLQLILNFSGPSGFLARDSICWPSFGSSFFCASSAG